MTVSLPSPEDWDWLKGKLEQAAEPEMGLLTPIRRLEWLQLEVQAERTELAAFVQRYGIKMLADASSAASGGQDIPVSFELDLQFAPGDIAGGRYLIQRFLGAGGMGEVYEAEDRDLGGRKVALKTIRRDLAGWNADARFEREVRVALQATHPNICRVFDVGRHGPPGTGRLFLTMELLQGELLSDRLRPRMRSAVYRGTEPEYTETRTLVQKPEAKVMREAEALPIILQLASGLSTLHRLGIVHRDFKPANVMLVPAEAGVRAVIMDFGLARATVAELNNDVTRAGANPGTPAYMDPDQSNPDQPKPAADVYALGITMHEMLTGERYLPGGSFQALRKAGVSKRLTDIVVKCLQPVRTRRFVDAGEVLAALESPEWRTFQRYALVVAAAVVVIAAGLVLFNRFRLVTPPSEPARLAYAQGIQSYFSSAPYMAAIHFQEAVTASPGYAVAQARLALAWQEAGMTGRAREAALRANMADVQRGLDARSQMFCQAVQYKILGEHAKAIPLFEELVRSAPVEERTNSELDLAAEYAVSEESLKSRPIWKRLAPVSPYAELRLSRLEDTPEKHLDALNKLLERYRRDHNIEGETYILFREALVVWTADTKKSLALFQTVIDRAGLSHDLYMQAQAYFQMAHLVSISSSPVQSEQYIRKGMELAREGGVELAMSPAMDALSSAALFQKDFVRAQKYSDDAIQLAKANQDIEGEMNALNHLVYLKQSLGKWEEAEADALRVYEYQSRRGLHDAAAKAAIQLNSARRELGKLELAKASMDAAKTHCLQAAEDKNTCLVHWGGAQAISDEQTGRYANAIQTTKDTIERAEASSVPVLALYNYANLATDLAITGDFAGALQTVAKLPDDGNWKPVKKLLTTRSAAFARPTAVRVSDVESILPQLADRDDRASGQVLYLVLAALTLDGSKLESALTGNWAELPAGAMRSTRLEFRLAKARGWWKLQRGKDAIAALGPMSDFQINPFYAWQAAVLMAQLDDSSARRKWQDAANAKWLQLESSAGREIAERIRARRKDLFPLFAMGSAVS